MSLVDYLLSKWGMQVKNKRNFLRENFGERNVGLFEEKNQENMILRFLEVFFYMEKSIIIFFNIYVVDWKI